MRIPKSKVSIVLFALLACTLMAAGCDDDPSGPAGPRGIEGVVQDESGNPVADAAVGLVYACGDCEEGVADDSGAKPTTMIGFSMPEAGHVTVVMLDRMGVLIQTIADGDRPAGMHAIACRFEDDDGNPVPSGTYRFVVRIDGEITRTLDLFHNLNQPAEILAAPHAVTDERGFFRIQRGLVAVGDVYVSTWDGGTLLDCSVSDTFEVLAVIDEGGMLRSGRTSATLPLTAHGVEVNITLP